MAVDCKKSVPLMELHGIIKKYGTVVANKNINLTLRSGEIHALLGENGAGKSTLVKMLYGVIEPTSGIMYWKGKQVSITSPVVARKLGIGMVFQHFSLFDEMAVAENIAVALSRDWSLDEVRRKTYSISKNYGLSLDPDRMVWSLSAGERQRIEIVRCLLQEPKLLILDEPTSVLTPQEAERLFETLERLSQDGCSILFISHRLDEVRRLCHTATIMRDGEIIKTLDPRTSSSREIAALMVGSEIGEIKNSQKAENTIKRLIVSNLSLNGDTIHAQSLKNISFTLHSGEVLGIAGIAGNGQSELFEALSGERQTSPEMIFIANEPVGQKRIDYRRKLNAAFVPEERLGHAAAPTHRLSENALVSRQDEGIVSTGFVFLNRARRFARSVVNTFDVRGLEPDPEARNLSGGNLQKYVIGREIISKPNLLIVNQPTWGVDAGAAQLIRQALVDLSRNNAAVLVISQDLDELFEISDKISVLHNGQLSTALPVSEWTKERIGLGMLGKSQTINEDQEGEDL